MSVRDRDVALVGVATGVVVLSLTAAAAIRGERDLVAPALVGAVALVLGIYRLARPRPLEARVFPLSRAQHQYVLLTGGSALLGAVLFAIGLVGLLLHRSIVATMVVALFGATGVAAFVGAIYSWRMVRCIDFLENAIHAPAADVTVCSANIGTQWFRKTPAVLAHTGRAVYLCCVDLLRPQPLVTKSSSDQVTIAASENQVTMTTPTGDLAISVPFEMISSFRRAASA
jgi:hypothetical protein